MNRVLRAVAGVGIAVIGLLLTITAVIIVEAFLPLADAYSFVVLPIGLVASIGAGVAAYLLLGRVTGSNESDNTNEETLDRDTDPYLQEEIQENVDSE